VSEAIVVIFAVEPVGDQGPKGDVGDPEVLGFQVEVGRGGMEDAADIDGCFIVEGNVRLVLGETKTRWTGRRGEEACGRHSCDQQLVVTVEG
jgi:hypothetical protein